VLHTQSNQPMQLHTMVKIVVTYNKI
jgi:hypothetical protein